MRLRLLLGVVLLLLLPCSTFAQSKAGPVSTAVPTSRDAGRSEAGLSFPSEHYPPSLYDQDPQNWAITQTDRGLLYVANNEGILEYDGEDWRTLPTPAGTFVRSLATDSLVYVGAKGDFGVLRPDSIGVLRYHSLAEHVPDTARSFSDVWNTHTLDGAAYYQTSQYLFRWDGSTLETWSTPGSFHTSFRVKGTLYVRDRERGLLRMREDSLVSAVDGSPFVDAPIRMMAPHPRGGLLIATENEGLFLLQNREVRRLSEGARLRAFLEEHDLYHGCALPNDRYALATLGGGTAIIDATGRILRRLDGSAGLPDDVVNYVYAGREGELWMALNNEGIYRTSLTTSTTLFDARNGLEGVIRDFERHEGRMYAATGRGLYRLESGGGSVNADPARFARRPGHPLAWDLLAAQDDLLAATEKGIYRVDDRQRITTRQAYTFARRPDASALYAGTETGITRLRRRDGRWTAAPVAKTPSEIRSLTVGPNGHLWAGTIRGRILYLAPSTEAEDGPRTVSFGPEAGLPEGYNSPLTLDSRLAIRSRKGLYHLQTPETAPSSWHFTPSSVLPDDDGADTLAVKAFLNGEGGRLWAALGKRVYTGRPTPNGRYTWSEVEALRFPKPGGVYLYAQPDSTLWLGTNKRAIRFTPADGAPLSSPPTTVRALVRRVTTLPEGTVLYGGAPRGATPPTITVPYSTNDLRIDVAAPLFNRVTAPQYQYRLTGRRAEWSAWTDRAHVTVSDLWEGRYTFRVRARGEKGRTSRVGLLTVHVEPPWYRSFWAYLLYGLGTGALLLGLRHYYRINEERKEAQKQALKLEKEREVRQQLERANKRLREANRLKEDFLANTSHELRTPLTNILGFVDLLREDATSDQDRYLDAIKKNSRRLERTLNALLDLSKLRSGHEEPELETISLGKETRAVARTYEASAREKGLSFDVAVASAEIRVEADDRYLDQILSNLIENAIKFTEEGYVRVSVAAEGQWATVAVEDSGIGIEEDFLPKLFRDFKQESRGRSRTHEGYGLGLAISARLAKRMEGHIEVESTKGEGSTFTLFLPRVASDPDAIAP
jgi:signal transduction histidine kinase